MRENTNTEREAFIRDHMQVMHSEMVAAHVWDSDHPIAMLWRAARASLPLPAALEDLLRQIAQASDDGDSDTHLSKHFYDRIMSHVQTPAVRPVTPLQCPKCSALWLHWPKEQSGMDHDSLNLRSATSCEYCEPASVDQLQRLERIPATLHAPSAALSLPAAGQEPVAWRTFDGEGGYDYRTYDDNESYRAEWEKRNPDYKGWVEPLYAAPQPAVAAGWVKIPGQLPEPGTPVLLDIGKKLPIRAMWVAKHTVEASPECPDDWAEYDEATDTYYCPEGWYEWNQHEETHWAVRETPRAWCELPQDHPPCSIY